MRRAWWLSCLVAVPVAACEDDGIAAEPPLCEALGACAPVGEAPAFSAPVTVAPSDALPAEVVSQDSHNNLDIVWHDGRLFFAFRTAPSHFASPGTRLYVVSTTDHVRWRYEGVFHEGRDLREPRFLSLRGKLHLYFALLGTDPLAFEPGGSRRSTYEGPGRWSEPEAIFPADFIPWRIRVVEDVAYLVGYTGGAEVYTAGAEPIEVHWLRSDDGEIWTPVVPDQPVVHSGGVSETDFAFLPGGGVVAVGRNEAGQDGEFGSRICRAEASDPGVWRCVHDPRKYDSPLVFTHEDQVWLVARRNATADGAYDLGREDLTPQQEWGVYQGAYWMSPKRCALWRVDPDALSVDHVLDLPSSGDTCFASAIPVGAGQYLVYNYSSPFDEPELSWLQGQTGRTFIYRTTVTLP